MVSLKEDRSTDKCFIIDLSHCRSDQVLAYDFARFETEIVRNIVSEFTLERDLILSNFIFSRDFLDGREVDIKSKLQEPFYSFINIIYVVNIIFKSILNEKIKKRVNSLVVFSQTSKPDYQIHTVVKPAGISKNYETIYLNLYTYYNY